MSSILFTFLIEKNCNVFIHSSISKHLNQTFLYFFLLCELRIPNNDIIICLRLLVSVVLVTVIFLKFYEAKILFVLWVVFHLSCIEYSTYIQIIQMRNFS